MNKIAIYEPDPRICGPGTWSKHLAAGFRMNGCECDVVSFTKSGKRKLRWGRCVPDKGQAQSSPLDPTRCARIKDAKEVLDEYDLVILPEPKSPTDDFAAQKNYDDEPEYVRILGSTRTPWATALHGKYYYEPDEAPRGLAENRGTPYLEQLLTLKNFTGFAVEHAPDGQFAQHSKRLREDVRRVYSPLPFELSVTQDEIKAARKKTPTLVVLGRVTKIKYRHYVNHMVITGRLRGWHVIYAGGSSCQQGPNEAYML